MYWLLIAFVASVTRRKRGRERAGEEGEWKRFLLSVVLFASSTASPFMPATQTSCYFFFFQIARDCTNTKMCETAAKKCKNAKEARTGDCDVTCCAADLCNAGSTRSPLLWLSVLCFITYEMLVNFHRA